MNHQTYLRAAGHQLSRVVALTFWGVLASTAFAGNPAEEMAKASTTPTAITGGTDPHGDSWLSIQHSLAQFAHPQFMLRLTLSMCLAVACAYIIAWHPRRTLLSDPLADSEERKALIILGLVGAVVAELSASSPALAFVIFGIGALLRFRTVLDNPKLTGKAITVVVIGLACGVGSWAMAVFVTLFSWVLVYVLESHVGCRIRIRLDGEADPQAFYGLVQSLFVSRRFRLQSSMIVENKRLMEFIVFVPAGCDPRQVEAEMRTKLPKSDESRIKIEAM